MAANSANAKRCSHPVPTTPPVADPNRTVALHEAVLLHESIGDLRLRVGVDATTTVHAGELAVLNTAETFLAWLRGPTQIRLIPGPVTDQATGLPTGTPIEGDHPVQIHDNEQFDLTLDFKDAKGFDTADTDPASWASADETVATLVLSEDTHTATVKAGSPGSTTVTVSVTLPTGETITATEAVDVVPAGATTVSLVEGAVSAQA